MTITEEQPRVDSSGRAAVIARAVGRVRIIGWSLALGWLCSLVVLVSVGERPGSYAGLAADLRAGQVSEVEVVDEYGETDAPLSASGHLFVMLRWRDGLVLRTATVSRATSKRDAGQSRTTGGARPTVFGSIENDLTALDPDVRVVPGEARESPYAALGFAASGWLFVLNLGLLVGTLMLIAGPRPWRATRWAWAWLVLLAPLVGIPAYFLLGGPTGLFRPKGPRRMGLTGGWAFLLALLLGGASSS